MKKLIAGLILACAAAVAYAGTFNLFQPVTGILKGTATTYVTTAAANADVRGLWTGSCSATTFLRGDGACSGVTSLSGTTSAIGGGALTAGACASTTVAVTSSTTAMAVAASPVTYPGDGNYWYGYVSTNGTVTVKVCAAVAGTPTSSTYNVRVLQ